MPIQIMLTEDVDSLGRSGDIVKVKPGFARNFLLPNKKALIADKNAIRMQARLQEERRKKAEQDKKESEELAKKIEPLKLLTHVKVDQEGHMYGSVSAADVAHLIEAELKNSFDRHLIQLKHPIKKLGVYTIEVKLKEGVVTAFELTIVEEGK